MAQSVKRASRTRLFSPAARVLVHVRALVLKSHPRSIPAPCRCSDDRHGRPAHTGDLRPSSAQTHRKRPSPPLWTYVSSETYDNHRCTAFPAYSFPTPQTVSFQSACTLAHTVLMSQTITYVGLDSVVKALTTAAAQWSASARPAILAPPVFGIAQKEFDLDSSMFRYDLASCFASGASRRLCANLRFSTATGRAIFLRGGAFDFAGGIDVGHGIQY